MGIMICMWFVDCDMFIEVEVGICCVYYDIMEVLKIYNLYYFLK